MGLLIESLKQGDALIHNWGRRYYYRGWVHGSDCHVLSTKDECFVFNQAFIVTPESLKDDFTKEEICKECNRAL